MSTANIKDYTAGDSFRMRFTVLDAAGSPINVAGITSAKWGISATSNGKTMSPPVVTKTLGAGISTEAGGVVIVTLAPGDIRDGGLYWHELQLVFSNGESVTAASGKFEVMPSIYPTT